MNTPTSAPQATRCLDPRCGRILRAAASIDCGYGPVCWARIRRAAAAITLGTSAQAADAAELIEDGGVVPTGRARVYRTVSTDGSECYLTHPAACTCPAGLKSKLCYHRLAVIAVESARTTNRPARRSYRLAA